MMKVQFGVALILSGLNLLLSSGLAHAEIAPDSGALYQSVTFSRIQADASLVLPLDAGFVLVPAAKSSATGAALPIVASSILDDFQRWVRQGDERFWLSLPDESAEWANDRAPGETTSNAFTRIRRADGATLDEKLEFRVSPKRFAEMKRAERVVVEVSSLMGMDTDLLGFDTTSLTLDELAYLQRFEQRVNHGIGVPHRDALADSDRPENVVR